MPVQSQCVEQQSETAVAEVDRPRQRLKAGECVLYRTTEEV